VFGAKKWPSLRLALLSPTKYMAIPNTLTGNVASISAKLESLGSYSVQRMWEVGRTDLLEGRKDVVDLKKDLGRLHKLERTLESIALTKKAEEMEVMYQNDPDKKGGVMLGFTGEGEGSSGRMRVPQQDDRRLFVDPSEGTYNKI
jgi:hypothetical protein